VELDTSLDQEYTYNANGDLIQKTEDVNGTTIQWNYTYSVDGWLTKVEKKVDAQTVLVEEYLYDPTGRKYKIITTEDTETTERYFVYDGGSILLELKQDADDYLLEKEYVSGLGGYLYTRDADGQTRYMHYDGRGNVVSITDEAREEVAYYEYDAWGNVLTACGDTSGELRFQTQQASLATGLTDFGYRWYDSSTGRWTQREPLGLLGGLNAYQYVYANPINLADAGGLRPFDPNDEYGGDPLRPIDSSDWDGSYNPLAGNMRVWNSAVNGFVEGLDNPAARAVHGAGQVAIGVVLCYGGAWQLGAPLVAMGLSNVADAISQGTGHGSFNPVREGGEALYRNVFGATPEEAAILWSWTELNFDVAGGICAVSYVKGRAGGKTGRSTYDDLVEAARKRYPKKAGRIETHHIVPKYLGGGPTGPSVRIDAAYHQMITNAFRKLWPYGTGELPSAQRLLQILRDVYSRFPLPR
jgi:RHS repeat-associated protein